MKIITDAKKIEEILTRGVEEVIEKESLLKKLRSGKQLRVKLGIDPTAPDLHLGNAVVLWKLREFQDLGHIIIFIIGDFTARIGDPSGKLSERKTLSEEEIKRNLKDYQSQISKILDLKQTKIVRNSKHLSKVSFAELYRISHFFSANQILERDMFQKRQQMGRPIWLHEFFYPIFQAYDSVATQADVEIGGNDQLFNMMMARQLQPHFNQKPQDVMTLKILVGLDGAQKMSKSLSNYIGITESSQEQYGKIMSIRDDMIQDYYELATRLPMKEIEKVINAASEGRLHPRDAKVQLAKEVITLYHGKAAAEKAAQEFDRVFKKKELPAEMPTVMLPKKEIPILDLLVKTKIVPSKSEGQRLVNQSGIKINGTVQHDWKKTIVPRSGMILQIGKRRFVKIA